MEKLKTKHKQMWLLVAGLAAVVLIMAFLYKSSHNMLPSFRQEYVKAEGDTIDVGIELNPTIYSVRGDSVFGKDYKIITEMSRKHGLPIKLHPFVPLSHAMDYLDKGLYDVVIASMPLTSELNERFLMTEPVYLDREVLIQRRDSTGEAPLTSAIQLARDTVWIPNDSPIRSRVENLAAEIGDTIYIESHPDYTAEHLFILVAKGKLKQAVINERIAKDMREQYPEVDYATPVSFTQFQSWAVSNSKAALRDSINAWLLDDAR